MLSDAPPCHAATPVRGTHVARITYLTASTSVPASSPPCRRRSPSSAWRGRSSSPTTGSPRAVSSSAWLASCPTGTPAFLDTPPNPTEAAVAAALEVWREGGCDGIVALGGGSPIDLAKGVALMATHDGPLEQYAAIYGGLGRITPAVAPIIAVPTTAGTGAEVGRAALLTLADGRKLGVLSPHLIPKRAICDPELTLGLPPGLTAATGLDALSHCIETYLSPRDNPPAEAIALDGAGKRVGQPRDGVPRRREPGGADPGDDGRAGGWSLVPEGPRRRPLAQPRARRPAGPEAAPRHAQRDPDAAGAALQRPRRRREDRAARGGDGAAGGRRSRGRTRARSTGGSGCRRGSASSA